MFDALEAEKPNHFAVRQYKKYKLAAGVVCSKRLLNQAVGKSLRTHNLKPKKGAQVLSLIHIWHPRVDGSENHWTDAACTTSQKKGEINAN